MPPTTTEKPHRAKTRATNSRAKRRNERELPAAVRERMREESRRRGGRQGAQQRRDHTRGRTDEQRRILALLRRRAGVSQILREIAKPGDTLRASLERALHLRRLLDAVAHRYPQAGGVEMDPQDLARTMRYLDGQIRLLEDEQAQRLRVQKRRAAQGGHARGQLPRWSAPAVGS
jgi:hypothetical protein